MQQPSYRPMRRKDRALGEDAILRILQQGEYGVLSTVDKEQNPYGMPLSYVMLDDALYFHCALSGQKLDNLAQNPQVSFCVVGKTQPVFDKNFTTYFESVIVFGTARPVELAQEKKQALLALCEKYLPEHMDQAEKYIAMSDKATAVYRISITHKTGKAKQRKS